VLIMDAVRGVYTSEQVMRLTGISRRKLSYWLAAAVVTADIDRAKGRGRVRLFSFQNLVEIRTAMHLRVGEEISLQLLRKVVSRMREELDVEPPLAELTLGVLRGGSQRRPTYRVVVQGSDGVWEHGEDGQRIFDIPLPLRRFTEELVAAAERDAQERRRPGEVERRRGALGSTPVLTGTRIPVHAVASLHEAGWSNERILDNYPSLTLADIEAVLAPGRGSRRSA
jgi:uncharacterized protein (DUF433 family)